MSLTFDVMKELIKYENSKKSKAEISCGPPCCWFLIFGKTKFVVDSIFSCLDLSGGL